MLLIHAWPGTEEYLMGLGWAAVPLGAKGAEVVVRGSTACLVVFKLFFYIENNIIFISGLKMAIFLGKWGQWVPRQGHMGAMAV